MLGKGQWRQELNDQPRFPVVIMVEQAHEPLERFVDEEPVCDIFPVGSFGDHGSFFNNAGHDLDCFSSFVKTAGQSGDNSRVDRVLHGCVGSAAAGRDGNGYIFFQASYALYECLPVCP